MRRMLTRTFRTVLFIAAFAAFTAASLVTAQQSARPKPPASVRLYILDCGNITGVGEAAFGFQPGQLKNTEMTTPCYLIVHPRGTLMWDTGEIPDRDFKAPGPTKAGAFAITKPLLPQLAALGYTPADITYLALSHYHGDHTANANAFAGSTWLVRRAERDMMFNPPQGAIVQTASFAALKTAKPRIPNDDEHDAFGD